MRTITGGNFCEWSFYYMFHDDLLKYKNIDFVFYTHLISNLLNIKYPF